MGRDLLKKAVVIDSVKQRKNKDMNKYRYDRDDKDNFERQGYYLEDDYYTGNTPYSNRYAGYGRNVSYVGSTTHRSDFDNRRGYNDMGIEYKGRTPYYDYNRHEPPYMTGYTSHYNNDWQDETYIQPHPLKMEEATDWVRRMKNSDGSTGELISMEEAKNWLAKKGYTNIPLPDFYAIINAMKSDYCGVAKMFNIVNDDFYGELAKAFIMDKDAKPYKTSLYMDYIVK